MNRIHHNIIAFTHTERKVFRHIALDKSHKVVKHQRDLLRRVNDVARAPHSGLHQQAVEILADLRPHTHHVHGGTTPGEEFVQNRNRFLLERQRQVRILAIREHKNVHVVVGRRLALDTRRKVQMIIGLLQRLGHVGLAARHRQLAVDFAQHTCNGLLVLQQSRIHQYLGLVVERNSAERAALQLGHKLTHRLL